MKKTGLLILLSLIIASVILIFKSNKPVNLSVKKSDNSDTISNNSLIIEQEHYILKLDNKKFELFNKEDLFRSIIQNRSTISKLKFKIFLKSKHNDRDFVLNFIDVLNQAEITNYKVFSSKQQDNNETKITKNEKIKTIEEDSIKMEFEDYNFKISFNTNQLISNDNVEIDNFIKNNLQRFKKSQIYIIAKSNTSYNETKLIFDLLSKYDLYNFKLISQ